MKIIMVCGTFLPKTGGVEIMALELAKYFTNKGHKVAVITGTPLDGFHDKFPFEVYRTLKGKPYQDGAILESIVNKFKPDIISSNDLQHIIPVIKLKRKLGCKVIFRTAGNDIEGAWFDFLSMRIPLTIRRRVLLRLLKKTDGIITNSEYTSSLLRKYGINNNIFKVVGGVKIEKFAPPENFKEMRREMGYSNEDKILLSVVRLLRFKGLDITINAIKLLKEKHPNIKYLIVGSGPSFDRIQDMIKNLNVEQHVSLKGFVPYNHIENYFKICDMYVHTPILYEDKGRFSKYTHTETMGRVYCQASACGKPCVGSNVGGVPEVIQNGVNGLLVQPENVKETAEAIERLICDSELRKKLGNGGLKLSHRLFSWDVVGEKVVSFLDHCAEK